MHAHDKKRPDQAPPAPETAEDAARRPPGAAAVMDLQRRAGNQAVTRMLDEQPVQRSAADDVLSSSGRPLDGAVQADMEARLGVSFSDVRVHTGSAAQRSAAELGARAYTSGNHVVIGSGGGDPHTLAHELTHVIQQRSGPVAGTDYGSGLRVSDPGDRFEREAEATARRVMAGPAPQGRQHPAAPHGTQAGATQRAVQRMPLDEFEQQAGALKDDPDFLAFFKIRRGREDPAAVVGGFGSDDREQLRRLVESAAVTPEFVQSCLAEYQQRPVGTRRQPHDLTQPRVAGLEMEIRNAVLKREQGMTNGAEIASTPATTEVGLPVLKLEIEGMQPGEPSVELIYGPLPVDDYRSRALISAREKLKREIAKKTNIQALVDAYNGSLTAAEQRYRLQVGPHPAWKKNQTQTPKINTQTNVSTPYSKLGAENPDESQDFGAFFEHGNLSKEAHARARTQAAALASRIAGNWSGSHPGVPAPAASPQLNSMLTQLLLQEAMYLNHRMDREKVRSDDKHHFHVLLKLSPQDAVMSIISDGDAKLLLSFLVSTRGQPLVPAVAEVFGAYGSHRAGVVRADDICRYLVDVLVARLVAGRQLLPVATNAARTSRVYGEARSVGDVTHVHPRPRGRIKITVSGGEYFMVVEQRSAKHVVNDKAETDPAAAVEQITNLQA